MYFIFIILPNKHLNKSYHLSQQILLTTLITNSKPIITILHLITTHTNNIYSPLIINKIKIITF